MKPHADKSRGARRRAAKRSENGSALAAAGDKLKPREVAFVAAYLDGAARFNAVGAAVSAGYARTEAERRGYELLRRPRVKAAIAKWKTSRLQAAEQSFDRYVRELCSIGYAQIRDVCDWDAERVCVLPAFLVPDSAHAAIAEIRQTEAGVHVKLVGKLDALRLLGMTLRFLECDENRQTEEQAAKIARILASLGSGPGDMQGG